MKVKVTLLSVIFLLLPLFFAYPGDDKDKRLTKPSTNDRYVFIAANNILMWISNNGDGSHDPRTDANGFYWPGGDMAVKSAIFEDGLLYGAKINNNEIRTNGNTHRQGLQAGKIINGIADDPSLEKYRVYKIKNGWEDLPSGPERNELEKDYNEWPIEDGAPYIDVNEDGQPTPGTDKPKFLGDETLWYVANDLDTIRTRFMFGQQPVGLEFQTTVFAFNNTSNLNDVVFKKYRIINKSSYTLNDMIISYWSDPDLGDAGDDYIGMDTMLNLGYVWNGDNSDGNGSGGTYGTPPPAAGYILLQGPKVPASFSDSAMYDGRWVKGFKNLPAAAFIDFIKSSESPYRDFQQGVPEGAVELYNYMQGKGLDGSLIRDPNTGNIVTKMVTGDPVAGTGWYEGAGWPQGPASGDRRMLISSATFTMNPGDTQEVVIGIVIAKGSNNKYSIAELKNLSASIKNFFNNSLVVSPLPPPPVLNSTPMDGKITLWWNKTDEDYLIKDPLLPDTIHYYSLQGEIVIPVNEKNYRFEGYRIWQYDDMEEKNPRIIATTDKENGITEIKHFLNDYFGPNVSLKTYAFGDDKGIFRYLVIDKDGDEPLYNGSPYYFGITSYAYSKYSDPPVIESEPYIIEAIPGIAPIDAEYTYQTQENIYFDHVEGTGDGEVKAKVIVPDLLDGHQYQIYFYNFQNSLYYNFVDVTSNDTLIKGGSDYSSDSLHKDIIKGFVLNVRNLGQEKSYINRPRVKSIEEVKGPNGTEIKPVNVYSNSRQTNMNSTGLWTLVSVTEAQIPTDSIQDFNYNNDSFEDYEIRFTENGSEYYSSGYTAIEPLPRFDPKGKNRVPFEVWHIPSDPTLQPDRLIIKIYDKLRDTSWSYSDNQYESFYTFKPAIPYPDTLPETSNIALGAIHKKNYKIGNIVIKGKLPATGTVIKIRIWKPLTSSDKFTAVMTAPKLKSTELAKKNINAISAFPNPYFRANLFNQDYPEYIRFTNLPQKITIRLFSLAGVFIKKIEKDDEGQYADWDLKNKDGYRVASGVYLAYLEIPGTAVKVMKIALVD